MHDPPNGLGPVAHIIFLQASKYEATHIFANLRIGGFGSGLLLNHLIKFALLPTPQSSFGGNDTCSSSQRKWIAQSLSFLDSLRGSSVKIGTIQRRLAWPLRKDDTHKSRDVII